MTRAITDIVNEGEALGVVAGAAASLDVTQTAAQVPVTPTGSISATNVQAALAELDTEKLASVGVSNLTATGTPSATTYLRGDGTWATPAGGGGGGTIELVHVRDQKASGTGGGGYTAGSWVTRTLNTVATNDVTGASLTSNQITLPAGTYEVVGSAPGYYIGKHKARLRNITASTTIVVGTSEWSHTTGESSQTSSALRGRFTLAVSSVLELQHRGSASNGATGGAGSGLGNSSSFDEVEVYGDLMFRKIS